MSAALPALAALVLQIVVHTCTADAGGNAQCERCFTVCVCIYTVTCISWSGLMFSYTAAIGSFFVAY